MISGIPISESLLEQLKQKLNVGNLRSIQLNCVPGRLSTRLDLHDLIHIEEGLPKDFLNKLLTTKKGTFKVTFDNLNLNFTSETNDIEKQLGLISKRLNRLENYNKEDLQEYGYETFGFGFPIVSFRPQETPEKVIKAPLFIWHLSIKKDRTKTNTWNISRSKDHEIEFNNLLRSYISQSNGLKIDDFSENELAEGYLDFDLLLEKTVEFIKYFSSSNSTELKESLRTGYSNGIQKVPSKDKLEKLANPIPKVYWCGVFGRFSQRNEAIRQEMYNGMFDLLNNDSEQDQELINELMHSETAALTDPSQEGILNYLKKNKHLIIQGPPGTGKSESITGIIINALEHGKKCLVVCEKKTAMDVLKRNLTEISPEVGELVAVVEDVSRDRKNVVNSVRDRYELVSNHYKKPPDSINLSDKLNRIEEYINAIQNRKKYLQKETVVNALDTNGFGGAVGQELKARFKNSDNSLIKKFKKINCHEVNRNFTNTYDFLKKFEEETSRLKFQHPLSFISNEKLNNHAPISLKEKLEQAYFKNTESLSNFIRKFSKELTDKESLLLDKVEDIFRELGKDCEEYEQLIEDIRGITAFKKDGFKLKLLKFVTKLNDKLLHQIEQFEKIPDLQNRMIKGFKKLNFELEINNERSLEAYLKNFATITDTLTSLQRKQSKIETTFYEKLIHSPFHDISIDQNTLEEVSSLKAQSTKLIAEFYTGNHTFNTTTGALRVLEWVHDVSEKTQQAIEVGFFDHYDWQSTFNQQSKDLQEIILILTDAKAKDWPSYYIEFYFHTEIKTKLDHSLSKNYESELKLLKEERDRIVSEIRSRIPKLWKAKQSKITSVNIPKLYNKRGSKGKRRNSLRRIAKKSFDSLTSYFPVMMVSPNVCASIFELKPDLFDYVIFDEASQLKIEESLSTLIRGKRKVVSGDSKQMPPSYWFTKAGDGIDDDFHEEEDDGLSWEENLMNTEGAKDLANSESLLHFAELCGFKSFYLDFHYRSHHPLLIEFSNAAFYKNRLHPLPERIYDTPIQFIPVNGLYENQRNKDEANIAIEILKRIEPKEDGDLPSVGIATFNQKQKNLILETIKKEIQIDEDFREKYRELEGNGLFVKNLENIQGDEREVLILSTTFGKDSNGNFVRKYGPIAVNGLGKRLLNVIVTRAKMKIYVLSSVPAEIYEDFKNELGESKELERGYFHAYIAYAKAVSDKDVKTIDSILNFLSNRTNTVSSSLNLTDSPFEEAVYQELTRFIKNERITLQYKAGGFRIDIAIKSKVTGKEYIAVECDGATYHGTPEDYAWDSYRQSILEEHGFIFHRIWSRDFWENADREIRKLVKFIHEQDELDKSKSHERDSSKFESDKFLNELLTDSRINKSKETDGTETGQKYEPDAPEISRNISTEKSAKIEKADQLAIEYDTSNKPKVEIGQVVLIEDLDTNKEMKVKFINGATGTKKENGVTILGKKSPIGVAMLDRMEGETVELNNLEKYFKIISVDI